MHVFTLDTNVNAAGVREFGSGTLGRADAPPGTLYIPMNQPLKHWIQAVIGEDPFEPIEFFYDVATVVVPDAPRPRAARASSPASSRPA